MSTQKESLGWVQGPAKNAKEKPTIENTFTKAVPGSRKTMRVIFWGKAGSGKTRHILSAPKPLYLIATEPGWEVVYDGLPTEMQQDIHVVEAFELDSATDEPDPIKSLQKIEKAIASLAGITKGTIAVDTVSDIWTWIQAWLEHEMGAKPQFQFQWGKANFRYQSLMLRIATKKCNVIFSAKSQDAYSSDGKIIAGQQNMRAQKETPHWTDITVHLKKSPDIVIPGQPVSFTGIIEKNRIKEVVNGQAVTVEYTIPETNAWNALIDTLITKYQLPAERFEKI